MSTALRRTGGVLGLILTAALGVGAGYIAFRPGDATDTAPADAPLTVEATSGSVGRSVPVAVTINQPFHTIATNSLAGVVTGIGQSEVDQGDVLYEVAGIPVRAIEGTVPMYRDLMLRAEGADVAQLQRALTQLGFPVTDDGEFGAHTRDAVEAWQKSLGADKTGVVALGTILLLPQLPTTVRLGEALAPGLQVGGGEDAVLVRMSEPRFTILTTAEVAAQVPAEASVTIRFEDTTWRAVVASSRIDQNGQSELTLAGADGGSPCADACSALPQDDVVALAGNLVIAADVAGVVVPVAAVQADASGATSVVLEDGTNVPVTVVASQDGRAVVEGIAAGQRVRAAESRG